MRLVAATILFALAACSADVPPPPAPVVVCDDAGTPCKGDVPVTTQN